jgi:copper(I)-binding protein
MEAGANREPAHITLVGIETDHRLSVEIDQLSASQTVMWITTAG